MKMENSLQKIHIIPSDQFHILIVDDLDDNRTLLRLDLEDELSGVKITEAQNGKIALEKIKQNNFSLVLCDLMMPDIDGFEVYRQAKLDLKNQDLPFIFISANQDNAVATQGLELGAIDFLKKPYDVSELILKTRNLCRLKYISDQQSLFLKKLEASNTHLKELNDQKDDVLRIVSHDIRNPLGNIIGLAQILLDEPNQEPEMIKNIAEVMVRSGENLLLIVNTLLDAARLETGKIALNLSNSDLAAIIREEIEQFRFTAIQKNIDLSFSSEIEPACLRVDEPKIRQAFANLISNAIKFTPDSGRVLLQLKENQESYIFTISDTGIGIEPEKIPIIFEKFSIYQRSGTNKEKGTGLGLSIVKAFVNLHHGEVSVQSEINKGTTFTIILPKVIKSE